MMVIFNEQSIMPFPVQSFKEDETGAEPRSVNQIPVAWQDVTWLMPTGTWLQRWALPLVTVGMSRDKVAAFQTDLQGVQHCGEALKG